MARIAGVDIPREKRVEIARLRDENQTLRAESDAALRWSWTPPIAGETLWNGEPVVTKNMVFVSTDRNTYAIDLRTRKPVWSYPLAGRLALTRSGARGRLCGGHHQGEDAERRTERDG